VALVSDLGVVNSLELAGSLLDGALDVFLGHRLGFGRVDRRSQPWVVCWIAAADLGGHRYLTNELGELRAALGIRRSLVVLDLLPFTVAGHNQLGGNCVAM